MTDIEPARLLEVLQSRPSNEAIPLFAHAGDAPITSWPGLLREVDIRVPSEYAIQNRPDGPAQLNAIKSFLTSLEPRITELAPNRPIAEEVVQKLRSIMGRYPYLDADGTITRLVDRIICETPAIQQGLFTVSQMPLPRGAEVLSHYLSSPNFKVGSGRDVLNAVRSMLLKIRESNATIVGYPGWEDEMKELFVNLFRRYQGLSAKDKSAVMFNKELAELQKVHPVLTTIIDEAKVDARKPPRTPTPTPIPVAPPAPVVPPAIIPPAAADPGMTPPVVDSDTATDANNPSGTSVSDQDLLDLLNVLEEASKTVSPDASTQSQQIDPAEVRRQAVEAQVNEYLDNKTNQALIEQVLGPLSVEDRQVLSQAIRQYIDKGSEPHKLHPLLFANLLKDRLRSGDTNPVTDDELGQTLYEHDKTVMINKEVEKLLESHKVYEHMQMMAVPVLNQHELEAAKAYFFATALSGKQGDVECIRVLGMYDDINRQIGIHWPQASPVEKECIQGICVAGLIEGKKLEDIFKTDVPVELPRALKPLYAREKATQYMKDRKNLFDTLDSQKQEYILGTALVKGMEGSQPVVDMALLSALEQGANSASGIAQAIAEAEKALGAYSQEVPQDMHERAYLKALLVQEAQNKRGKYLRSANSNISTLAFTHKEFMDVLFKAKRISAIESAHQQAEKVLQTKVTDRMSTDILPDLNREEMNDLKRRLTGIAEIAVGSDPAHPLDEDYVRNVLESQLATMRELMFESIYAREANREVGGYEHELATAGKPSLNNSKVKVIRDAVIEFKKKRKAYNIGELAQAA